jgi:hypothetical protein
MKRGKDRGIRVEDGEIDAAGIYEESNLIANLGVSLVRG